jgi:RNA polymerase sigma-70 factor (ECF subfamily)
MLIRRVLSGERQAYAGLVREHQREILRLCRSLVGDPAKAEDAAQEAFLRAYKALADFKGNASFLTWISRIASNFCLELLRKEGRRREDSWDAMLERTGEKAHGLLHEPADGGRSIERREVVESVLSVLSPEHRLALTLRELQGFSYDEISQAMGCTVDSVKARLRRARAKIVERLGAIDRCRANE